MPSFHVEVPHNMTEEDAANRIKDVMERMRGRFEGQVKDMQQDWNGNSMQFSFKTMGLSIKGEMVAFAESVIVKGDLPFAAMLFKGRIESSIREELGKVLD